MPEENRMPKDPIEVEPGRTVNLRIEITPPDSHFYSNVSGVNVTPWDIRIHFADLSPRDPMDTKSKAVVGVIMPPEHAAGLMLLLLEQVQVYEKQFGPIRLSKWAKLRASAEQFAAAEQKTKPQEA